MLSKEKSVSPNSLLNQPYVYIIKDDDDIIKEILKACYELNIQSILVEGGAKTLQSFINTGFYDEIRVVTNTNMFVEKGLNAPMFPKLRLVSESHLLYDRIEIYNA